MKKQGNCLQIAGECFGQSCSSIRTRVSLYSLDGKQKAEDVVALWDTGSTSCGVSADTASRLGLKQVDTTEVTYGDGEKREEPVYILRLRFLPSGYEIYVKAAQFSDNEREDFIFGMELIRYGTMLLEPMGDGAFRFTFSVNNQSINETSKSI